MGRTGLYANRVRCAYVRRHNRKSRCAFMAAVLLVLVLLGIACEDEQRANEGLDREFFSQSSRSEIVARWSEGVQARPE